MLNSRVQESKESKPKDGPETRWRTQQHPTQRQSAGKRASQCANKAAGANKAGRKQRCAHRLSWTMRCGGAVLMHVRFKAFTCVASEIAQA